MKISRMEVTNFKRIRAVAIEPKGQSVTIGGKNSAGKSSIIDALLSAMAGKKFTPVRPIRDGASKSESEFRFDNGMIVREVITASGGRKLEVRDPGGVSVTKPQTLLDTLTNGTAFDISEFVNMDKGKQVAVLQEIAGLDLEKMDREYQVVFADRTNINRDAKRLEAQLAGMKAYPEAYAVDVKELLSRMEAARKQNDAHAAARRKIEAWRVDIAKEIQACKDAEAEIEQLRKDQVQREENIRSWKADAEQQSVEISTMVDADLAPIQAQIAGAQEANAQVESNAKRLGVYKELVGTKAKADELTAMLEKNKEAQQSALENADMPIEGLGIEDGTITFGGIPFSQCGEAEKYMIATAIGLRRIPADGARFLIMRNGGALDEEHLAKIKQVVGESDAQLFIEVPRTNGVDIVIEDGSVAESEA